MKLKFCFYHQQDQNIPNCLEHGGKVVLENVVRKDVSRNNKHQRPKLRSIELIKYNCCNYTDGYTPTM